MLHRAVRHSLIWPGPGTARRCPAAREPDWAPSRPRLVAGVMPCMRMACPAKPVLSAPDESQILCCAAVPCMGSAQALPLCALAVCWCGAPATGQEEPSWSAHSPSRRHAMAGRSPHALPR